MMFFSCSSCSSCCSSEHHLITIYYIQFTYFYWRRWEKSNPNPIPSPIYSKYPQSFAFALVYFSNLCPNYQIQRANGQLVLDLRENNMVVQDLHMLHKKFSWEMWGFGSQHVTYKKIFMHISSIMRAGISLFLNNRT